MRRSLNLAYQRWAAWPSNHENLRQPDSITEISRTADRNTTNLHIYRSLRPSAAFSLLYRSSFTSDHQPFGHGLRDCTHGDSVAPRRRAHPCVSPDASWSRRTRADGARSYPPSYMNLMRTRQSIPKVVKNADGKEMVVLLKEEEGADGASSKGRPVGPYVLELMAILASVLTRYCSQYWDRDEKIKFMDVHGIDVSVCWSTGALRAELTAFVTGRVAREPLAGLPVGRGGHQGCIRAQRGPQQVLRHVHAGGGEQVEALQGQNPEAPLRVRLAATCAWHLD